VEVLKQGQYAPMLVEEQVMIIYAVTNGLLDDVNPSMVKEWEADFHTYMKASHPEIGQSIATEKALTKPNEAALREAIADYKKMAAPAAAR
jgi:F-type H+/Na+-transporting ATPase subunit alpha